MPSLETKKPVIITGFLYDDIVNTSLSYYRAIRDVRSYLLAT